MTWKDFTYHLALEFCNLEGRRTFDLSEFYDRYVGEFASFAPANDNRKAKVRQQLQLLRDDGLLLFVDNRGTYTLQGVPLLKDEVDEPEAILAIPSSHSLERDYMVEVQARDRGWVRMAKRTYGDLCLLPGCSNTFVKEDGGRYIEVHHIQPLCEGGEEQIWNLSVVCAHHHRMAHFAIRREREDVRELLLDRTQAILTGHRP